MESEKSGPHSQAAFARIARSVSVIRYLGHRDYLAAVYAAAKAAFAPYSYLRFAADMGFSTTNVLRLVIAGERPLTSKAAARVAQALELKGAELRYWTALVRYAEATAPAERERLFRALVEQKTIAAPEHLDPAHASYFGEWFHPVVREMIALPGFDGTPEWIRDRLAFPLRLDHVKRSLDLLVSLRYARCLGKHGPYAPADDAVAIATPAEVDGLAIVSYHQSMIERGREAITRIDENAREVRAITVRIPASRIALLKAKIEGLTAEILEIERIDSEAASWPKKDPDSAAAEDPVEVVQINVQVFPFTRRRTAK